MLFKMKHLLPLLLMLTALPLFIQVSGQICPLPTDQRIESLFENEVINVGGEGAITVTVHNYHYTCQAIAAKGFYRYLSLAVNYTDSNGGSGFGQFEMECMESGGNHWEISNGFIVVTIDIFSTETRIDCFRCAITGGNDAHCVACHENCTNIGLGACTGSGEDGCCPYFDSSGSCIDSCMDNFAPNEEYTCECNLTCENGSPYSNCSACECPTGFTGDTCAIDIDECETNSCDNGGTCVDDIAGYTCICGEGYTGANCTTDIDECESNPCDNGGTCVDGIAEYTCICVDRYTGENCTTDIDECESKPCDNGGTCVDGIAGYTCICAEGYTGKNCTTDIDECESNLCDNGGTCVDGIAEYTCICVDGYTGENCTTDIDECESNPCDNGGTCFDGIAEYTCMCVDGYTGENCTTDIDECESNSCDNGGTCVDGIAGYTCICAEGYTGSYCDIIVVECQPNLCQNGGSCEDRIRGYACLCAIEFTGVKCETSLGINQVCIATCSEKADTYFENNLCRFYCQLEKWREIAIQYGLDLPEVETTMDSSLSNDDAWAIALQQQLMFRDMWMEFAESQGFSFIEQNDDDYDDSVSEFQSEITNSRDYYNSWRKHAQMINSELMFTDFDEVNVDEDTTQEESTSIFNSYNERWSEDMDTFLTEFDEE